MSENRLQPFHLAIPVNDLGAARRFYREVLNCSEGRSDERWVDFDFFGHQLVIHAVTDEGRGPDRQESIVDSNPVDGHDVPVPHFGIVLEWARWELLAERLCELGVRFVVEPHIRFQGHVGEQATMFFLDPSGNALEFKSFRDPSQLFAT